MSENFEPKDSEQTKFVPDEYQGRLKPNYYCRRWIPKREKYCENRAGANTEHSGEGRCYKHGGQNISTELAEYSQHRELIHQNRMTPAERYGNLPDTLQDFYDEQSDDTDPLDVISDIKLARAVLRDYIERYYEKEATLERWEEWYRQEMKGHPPSVELLPVEHVVTFLKKVTDIAQKEKKLNMQDAISFKDFHKLMAKMGHVVEKWVMQEDMEPEEKLRRIKDGWMSLDVNLGGS